MFNEYPYTDYHELNTDWIISKIKNVETAEANTKQYAEDADAAKVAAEDARDIAVEAKDDAVRAKDDAVDFLDDTKDQLDLLQARVDNIIPDGTQTAGNTELLDIRVGYDAQTYVSAGDAVRGQVEDLHDELTYHEKCSEISSDILKHFVESETSVTGTVTQNQAIYTKAGGYVTKADWQVMAFSITAGNVYHIVAENYNDELTEIALIDTSDYVWTTADASDIYVYAGSNANLIINRNWRYSPNPQVGECTLSTTSLADIEYEFANDESQIAYLYDTVLDTSVNIISSYNPTVQVYANNSGGVVQLVSFDGGSYFTIPVNPGEKYYIDSAPDATYPNYMIGYNNIIKVTSASNGDAVIPYGCNRLYINNNWRNYTAALYKYMPSEPKYNTIRVKSGGGGNFTTVKAAIDSITDSSYNNRYNVEIYDGIYDIYTEFGGDAWFAAINDPGNNMNGLLLPDYVNLIGVGDVTLTMRCADAYATSTNVPLVSLLNLQKNNDIKNIKFYAKNVRYVVHDETNNTYNHTQRLFENCYFEHEGNVPGTWYAMYALGCGSGDGSHYVYRQCTFKDIVPPYLMHNNVSQTEPTIIEFYGCKFIDTVQNSCIYLSALAGSTANCYAYLYDCQLSGGIYTAGDKWYVRGGGNSEFPHWQDGGDTTVYFEMSDSTANCIASGAITRMQAVMLTNPNTVEAITAGSEDRFYGIALNDASSGDPVVIQYKGFVDCNDSSITANNGDIAYITGSGITINSGTNKIGYIIKSGSCFSIKI